MSEDQMENEGQDSHVLKINVNQSHIRNAVRDLVNQLLDPATCLQSHNAHVEKEQARITKRVDEVIDKICVPSELVYKLVDRKLENNLKRMVEEIVQRAAENLIREQVSIALRHMVEKGMVLEIGTGWNQKVKIKTEVKES